MGDKTTTCDRGKSKFEKHVSECWKEDEKEGVMLLFV